MGWKNVKEHYRIKHNVQVTSAGICIGSDYAHDIIIVSLDGNLAKRYERRGNEDLERYQQEMEADPAALLGLIKAKDIFASSITVYTYEGGDVLERKCEELGWPNTTHEGEMMYENTFSTDRKLVARWAANNALAGIRMRQQQIERMEKELSEYRQAVELDYANLERLKGQFPKAVEAAERAAAVPG